MSPDQEVYEVGSLCSGYGGLDAAVLSIFGGNLAWVADNDPEVAKILAHRYPGITNLGDFTTFTPDDWAKIPPVQILTMGFPCQDVSTAGKRAGLHPGTRSGLWLYCAEAIAQLRPQLVVIENVRGLLSADAHSDVEPCEICVGDGPGVRLRALGAVLGDLATLGFDAEWTTLPASDAGACHLRERVFILAWPRAAADASAGELQRRGEPGIVGAETAA